MARTAGFARFHIKHRMADPVRSGNEDFVVALGTGKRHVKVGCMTENRAARQRNLSNSMTLDTISFYRKSAFSIMTAATRSTLLHLCHGHMRICLICFEERIMTIRTGEHVEMLAMFEHHLPEIGNNNGYGINGMAA